MHKPALMLHAFLVQRRDFDEQDCGGQDFRGRDFGRQDFRGQDR